MPQQLLKQCLLLPTRPNTCTRSSRASALDTASAGRLQPCTGLCSAQRASALGQAVAELFGATLGDPGHWNLSPEWYGTQVPARGLAYAAAVRECAQTV